MSTLYAAPTVNIKLPLMQRCLMRRLPPRSQSLSKEKFVSAPSSTAGSAATRMEAVEGRPLADFPPSIWGDYFLYHVLEDSMSMHGVEFEEKRKELQEEVKRMIVVDVDKPFKTLDLINQVQRLGISYLFEKEIGEALEQIHKIYFECVDGDVEGDLSTIAILFRLLRQEGYRISCDIFFKFKDEKGSFSESHATDIQGLLCLYEASQMRTHGDDVLEEALGFSTTHLQSSLENKSMNPSLKAQVKHALKQSIHKGLPRLESRRYFPIYQQDPLHHNSLLTLAKIEFNVVQQQHQQELHDISRWWKELDFKTSMYFARDRVVECFFWVSSTYFEPKYGVAREIFTKILALTSILDDVYDAYGTMDELKLFTDAMQRWEISALDKLPNYMQILYKALLDTYDSVGNILSEQGRSSYIHYAKEAMKKLVQNYLDESYWLHQQQVPSIAEYMSISLITVAYPMMATTAFVGMGNIVTEDVLEWSLTNPKIVKASAAICRLAADIVTRKFERKRGYVTSSIECYMKQHNVTEEQAEKEIRKQVAHSWKDINGEIIRLSCIFPMPIVMRVLNLARVADFMYKDEDHYTNPHIMLKDVIASLYIDPVPV